VARLRLPCFPPIKTSSLLVTGRIEKENNLADILKRIEPNEQPIHEASTATNKGARPALAASR
jgi:hypothetical protein